MVEIEILINKYKDKKKKQSGLLQPGYSYHITKER